MKRGVVRQLAWAIATRLALLIGISIGILLIWMAVPAWYDDDGGSLLSLALLLGGIALTAGVIPLLTRQPPSGNEGTDAERSSISLRAAHAAIVILLLCSGVGLLVALVW